MLTINNLVGLFEKTKALALNKPEQEAADIFKEHGFMTRVLYRDGERFYLIQNYVPRRVTFGIENGIVVEAVQG